jgi:hypothetical protein
MGKYSVAPYVMSRRRNLSIVTGVSEEPPGAYLPDCRAALSERPKVNIRCCGKVTPATFVSKI